MADEDTFIGRNTRSKGKERAGGTTTPELSCYVCNFDGDVCDGERPCSACIRKGINEEGCKDGCRACQLAQLACDGKIPCTNCARTSQDCAISDNAPRLTSSAAENAVTMPLPIRLSTSRTKTACMACRRDNKRCEVSRPCARCLHRGEECIDAEKEQTIVKKRCLACRLGKGKCEDQRPCSRCVEKDLICEDVPRKAGGPGSRSRRACANCRRGKLQCEDKKPCKNCVRRGLDCVEPGPDKRKTAGSHNRNKIEPSTRTGHESSTIQSSGLVQDEQRLVLVSEPVQQSEIRQRSECEPALRTENVLSDSPLPTQTGSTTQTNRTHIHTVMTVPIDPKILDEEMATRTTSVSTDQLLPQINLPPSNLDDDSRL